MIQSFKLYLERIGIMFDEMINVLLGGVLNQTVSLRTALAARAGKRWGCVLCKVLSVLVQPDHCENQFNTSPTTFETVVRAGLAFSAAFAAVGGVLHLILGAM